MEGGGSSLESAIFNYVIFGHSLTTPTSSKIQVLKKYFEVRKFKILRLGNFKMVEKFMKSFRKFPSKKKSDKSFLIMPCLKNLFASKRLPKPIIAGCR